LINTSENRRNVWPIPGICAVTRFLFTNLALTTGRLAEFGFRGVTIFSLITRPRTCGHFKSAGERL
jgi:hypothetical protein